MLGRADAPLTLVMYGDYTCPYTRRASAVMDVARRKLGRRVRYAFRHFPREELHPDASLLAEAAHAAAAQGKFWEMHQALLLPTSAWTRRRWPSTWGSTSSASRASCRPGRTGAHVAREMDGGVRSGVTGTPTIFINDKRHMGSWETGSLLRALGGAPAMARSAHL